MCTDCGMRQRVGNISGSELSFSCTNLLHLRERPRPVQMIAVDVLEAFWRKSTKGEIASVRTDEKMNGSHRLPGHPCEVACSLAKIGPQLFGGHV